jgi:hypothetical protein
MLNLGGKRAGFLAVGFFFGVWILGAAPAMPATPPHTLASVPYSLVNGPFGAAGAKGWYPGAAGTASADSMHDFTALKVPCLSNGGAGSSNGSTCNVNAAGAIIVNEADNTGSSSDVIRISASAPPGYLVRLYAASACSGGGTNAPRCTQGNPLTLQSTNGGSVNAVATVLSGAAYYYEAVYNASGDSATPFTAYVAKITAAGRGGAGKGADSNDTYNVLYPGGVVRLTNGVSVTTANCRAAEPDSPPVGVACRGAELRYTIAYENVVPADVASNLGTEPAFAYGPLFTAPGSLLITDDGTAFPNGAAGQNNWTTYTGDIAAAATDTTSKTLFMYFPSGLMTFSADQTKFICQIGGARFQLPPGGSGTVAFTAVVK